MKKFIVSVLFGIVLCMNPVNVFAKTICFSMHVGLIESFFYLSGGKVDQKPFSGKFLGQQLSCVIPAWASIVTDGAGIHYISINMPHDSAATCNTSAVFHASGATTLGMIGEIDVNQDGTHENIFSLSEINCNSIEQQ